MNKRYFYINGIGLISLFYLSMSFADDSHVIIQPPVNSGAPFIMDNGHVENSSLYKEYDADGTPQTTSTCPGYQTCIDTRPNTVCPTGSTPYVSVSQYAGWGSGTQDLYYAYSVCVPQNYSLKPNIKKITSSSGDYYQVTVWSQGLFHQNEWTGSGVSPINNTNFSFSWTLYCYPSGISIPKLDSQCLISQ